MNGPHSAAFLNCWIIRSHLNMGTRAVSRSTLRYAFFRQSPGSCIDCVLWETDLRARGRFASLPRPSFFVPYRALVTLMPTFLHDFHQLMSYHAYSAVSHVGTVWRGRGITVPYSMVAPPLLRVCIWDDRGVCAEDHCGRYNVDTFQLRSYFAWLGVDC